MNSIECYENQATSIKSKSFQNNINVRGVGGPSVKPLYEYVNCQWKYSLILSNSNAVEVLMHFVDKISTINEKRKRKKKKRSMFAVDKETN